MENKSLTPESYWEEQDVTYQFQIFIPAPQEDFSDFGYWQEVDKISNQPFEAAQQKLAEYRKANSGYRYRIQRTKWEVYHEAGF